MQNFGVCICLDVERMERIDEDAEVREVATDSLLMVDQTNT